MELKELVVNGMTPYLEASQIEILQMVFDTALKSKQQEAMKSNAALVKLFIESKQYEECSAATLNNYVFTINKFSSWLDKNFSEVTKHDIENYLIHYKNTRNVKSSTLNNVRHSISAFYTWCVSEDYLEQNPVTKTKSIKQPHVIKETFSDSEINAMRDACKCMRDLAILETLYTTGVRISELCSLNRADIVNRTAIVRGKGNKERKIYFSESAWYYVEKYLETRHDNNPALFIGIRASTYTGFKERITKDNVEAVIRNLGKAIGIRAYPHKFRRTVATKGAKKGIPIQNIQAMLGHTNINTTMIYCQMVDEEVRYSHDKFL